MDERGYVAEALLDRLRDDGVQFCALAPDAVSAEVPLAVEQDALPGMPRRIARFGSLWRGRRDVRLLAHAAKHASWDTVRGVLPRLRRALYRALPNPFALLSKAHLVMHPRHATVAFVGFDNSGLRERVARDLAPAFPSGLDTLEQGY